MVCSEHGARNVAIGPQTTSQTLSHATRISVDPFFFLLSQKGNEDLERRKTG